MAKSIYLVNPTADFPSYFGAEAVEGWGMKPASSVAELAIPSVAAMVPEDFDVQLCDENVMPIDFDVSADFVAITGKVSQWSRMREVAHTFRERGRKVIIGGPFASLSPEIVGEHCDILVRGEIEEIAADLFSDLRGSSWKSEYIGTRPSLDLAPPPRWDLYPNDQAFIGSLQTSRGCPFQCDFCDVIEYLGRLQRHKSVANVLRELDELYRVGYRLVFLCDDNFTVARSRAKELLSALADWNNKQEDGKVVFSTQLSIDATKDEELLEMCAAAGLTFAFVGIETPNMESLQSSKKRQNVGVNLVDEIQKLYDHGIMITGGMIVGFDNDGHDIFERQYEFATQAAIPIATLGSLVAPAATPLYDRLQAEGRLVAEGSEVQAVPWSTNILPKMMSQDELLRGVRWLANKLYDPREFGDRLLRFMDRVGERRDPKVLHWRKHRGKEQLRDIERNGGEIVRRLMAFGPEEAKMAYRVFGAVSKKPEAFEFARAAMFHYAQIRYMYAKGQFFDNHVAAEAQPF